jgi:hypothetical protein
LLTRNTSQYEQALPLLQRTLAIMQKVLGTTHPSTITIQENLSVLRAAMDK